MRQGSRGEHTTLAGSGIRTWEVKQTVSGGIEIRPFASEDIRPIVELLNRCLTSDPITLEVFQKKVLLDRNFETDGAPVACDGEKIVGFALGLTRRYPLEDAEPDSDRAWITLIAVDEGSRRRGIGSQLLQRLELFFASRGCKVVFVSPYSPNYFTPGVDVEAYPEALAFFKSAGYEEAYRPLAMDANLVHLKIPEQVIRQAHALRESVTVEPYRPELALGLMDFLRREFPGDWQRVVREAAAGIAAGERRPDSLWVAHESGCVIGFCQHDRFGRFGPFGVAESERGRGIGVLLLFNCLQAMRANGLHNAWFMWTDDRAARLYSRAGFVETRRFAVLKKDLK